jgi:hypothetical protein
MGGISMLFGLASRAGRFDPSLSKSFLIYGTHLYSVTYVGFWANRAFSYIGWSDTRWGYGTSVLSGDSQRSYSDVQYSL